MWTSTDLLEAVKERAMYPDSGGPLSDADILQLATDELHATVVPLVLAVRSDFGVVTKTFSYNAGENEFRIPSRAIAGKIRSLKKLDSSGNEIPCPIYSVEQTVELQNGGAYIEGDYLYLMPVPTQAGRLVLRYYARPGELATLDSEAIATVTGVNIGSTAISVDHSGGSWGWDDAQGVDIYSSEPNFGYKSIGLSATYAGPFTIEVPLGTKVAVGDHLASFGKSLIPNVPAECHNWLTQLTVCRLLEALGDKANLSTAKEKADELKRTLVTVLAPRSEGLSATLVNRSILGV